MRGLRSLLLVLLSIPFLGALASEAAAAGVPVPAAQPAPKADVAIPGKALTGGPYLDLMLATEYETVWTPQGSDAEYYVVFSRPINLPPGYYALGSAGKGNMAWSENDPNGLPLPPAMGQFEPEKMLVAKELVPGSLARPTSYYMVWNDAGSGADADGALWEAVPPPGYECLGTVVADNSQGQPPSLDAIRCVKSSLLVEAQVDMRTDAGHVQRIAQFWDVIGIHGVANVGPTHIRAKDPHGPAFGIDLGLFHAFVASDSRTAAQYTINSLAVAKLDPPAEFNVETFIQTRGPIVRLHPNELYLPDSAEFVLNNFAELCSGVIRHDGSYSSVEFGNQICARTSAAGILDDDVMARTTDPTRLDPDFRTYLSIPDGALGGSMGRAIAYVHVKSTNQVFIDLQFWLYYPFNGPAKSRVTASINGDEVLNYPLSVAPTGQHHSDWEYVTLRMARATHCAGCLYFSHVLASAHDTNLEVATNDPGLKQVNGHPVVYSAKDSHAHYLGAGDPDRGLAFRVFYDLPKIPTFNLYAFLTDFTADGGPAWEVWQPGKHRVIASQWDSVVPRPVWSYFPMRWGQFEKQKFGYPCFTIPVSLGIADPTVCPNEIYKEVGSGPFGPVTKETWADVKDTTPPVVQLYADALGMNGWQIDLTFTTIDVTEPQGAYVKALCPTLPYTVPERAGPSTVVCAAYSDGGIGLYVSEPFKIDSTPPVVTIATLQPPPNANGWNNTSVNVTFSCTDAKSGIAFCSPPQLITTEGAAVLVEGGAMDVAGNVTKVQKTLKIDLNDPVLVVSSPLAKDYLRTDKLFAIWDAIDAQSGIATQTAQVDSLTVAQGQAINLAAMTNGPHEFTLFAEDKAGNRKSRSVIFNVTGAAAPPQADLAVTIPTGPVTVAPNATFQYVISVHNNGPAPADGGMLADPAVVGMTKTLVTCTPVNDGKSLCPSLPTVAQLEGAGVLLDAMQSGGTLNFTITAKITATSGTVTHAATATPPSGTPDPVPGNNTATQVITVGPGGSQPQADLSVSLSTIFFTLAPGDAPQLSLTVTNNGPAAADGATISFPAVAGMTKNSVTCTASGLATCPVAPTVALLEGGGLVIPALPASGSVSFQIPAKVTAAGGNQTHSAIVILPAGTIDPVLGNNSRSILIAVRPPGLQPQAGWWWNPAESGRGFFIQSVGNQWFLAGYFYDASGRGTWAVVGGVPTTSSTFSDHLLAVNGGQTLTGAYKAPISTTDLGLLTLSFADQTHGTLTWPGGTIAIERQIYGSGAQDFAHSGWWWNPAESGRGYSIEIQGDTMDVVSFMYDASGNPLWYISTGKMSTPTHYTGTLQLITGGQTMTGPYKAPTASTPAGVITIDFTSNNSGTVTLADTVGGSVTMPIKPQLY